jgi:hypothetical protein
MHFNIYDLLCSCVFVKNEEFDTIDVDHDGRISLNEFHSFFVKKYGRPPSNDQWFKFHLTDTNNNGYISKYDVEMFEKQNTLFH